MESPMYTFFYQNEKLQGDGVCIALRGRYDAISRIIWIRQHNFFVNQYLNIPVTLFYFFLRNRIKDVIECRLLNRFSPCSSLQIAI